MLFLAPDAPVAAAAWVFVSAVVLAIVLSSCSPQFPIDQTLAAYREEGVYGLATIHSPLNGTLFPPEIASCTVTWEAPAIPSSPALHTNALNSESGSLPALAPDTWLVWMQFSDRLVDLHFVTHATRWTPAAQEWEQIKKRSRGSQAKLTILGVRGDAPRKILARGQVRFSTSTDEVGAPLFYREVNLPFMDAVKDPSRIRWRFGTIDSRQPPPVVLEHLPVCGNCHSFSQDGRTLGMDVDYANNKGSYVITRVGRQMVLASSEIMTWDNYRPEDHRKTYGLLSQVSPDGQTVISTVKDKSVFAAKPDLAFSQRRLIG